MRNSNMESKKDLKVNKANLDFESTEGFCEECQKQATIQPTAASVDYNNLSQEVKRYYADLLNFIFRGTIGTVQAYQVTPNVAKAGDFFLKQILHCSQGITAALVSIPGGIYYSKIYEIVLEKTPFANIPFVFKFLSEQISSYYVGNLIGHLLRTVIYRPCVDKVNVNWKSQMGLLLGGIIDDLAY